MWVGLIGEKQSGKTTTAKIMREHHGFKEIAFADTLKHIAVQLFGLSSDMLWGETKETETKQLGGATPRKLLQVLGDCIRTDMVRRLPELKALPHSPLTRAALRKAELFKGKNVVFSDVRSEDEAKAILEHGGFLFAIVRKKEWETVKDNHWSESRIPQLIQRYAHVTIANNKTVEHLRETLDRVLTADLSKVFTE